MSMKLVQSSNIDHDQVALWKAQPWLEKVLSGDGIEVSERRTERRTGHPERK